MAGQRRSVHRAEARRPGPSLWGGRRPGEGRAEAARRAREGAEEMAFAEAEKVTVSGAGCRVANASTDIGGGALGLGRQEGQPWLPNAGSPVAPERISQSRSPFGRKVISFQPLKALDGA